MGVNGIYGLSGSGLDIESMVKVGMLSKQNEYDKMQQKLTTQSWKKEAYNTVYTDLSTYNYSTLSQYKMQSTMDAKSATSSNTSVATVSANGAAAAMTHTIEVESMASNAYLLTGEDGISRSAGDSSTSIYLKDLIDTTGMQAEDKLTFTIDDGENKATVSISYSQIFNDNQTLYDLASAISNAKTVSGDKLNLTASYDATNDTFAIYNDVGGAKNKIQIGVENTRTGDMFNRLNLQQVTQSNDTDGSITSTLGTKVDFSTAGIDAAQSVVTEKQAVVTEKEEALSQAQADETAASAVVTEKQDAITAANEKVTRYQDYVTQANAWSNTYTEAGDYGTIDKFRYTRPDWMGAALAELGITDTVTNHYTETNADRFYKDRTLVAQIKTAAQNALGTEATDSTEATGLYRVVEDAQTDYDAAVAAAATATAAVTVAEDELAAAQAELVTAQTGYDDALAAYQSGTQGAAGTDGTVKIDGRTYTTDTNKVTASNVIYTIVGTGKSTVNVTQDTDAIIDKVKSFVEDYNKLLDGLYDKYMETKYSDYKPLTDAQKENMKEEQIEKWEAKAKSGLLYHDATIGKILDKMREAVATPVDGLSGKYNSAYSIGIDTSKTNGHLKLDEDKLKKALAEEPSSVYEIFGTLPEEDDDYDGMGVAQRLGDVMVSSLKEIKTYAGETSEASDGSTLGDLMMELQTKMSNFKTLMAAFEDKLYKKYDAMEVALSQLGTQLNYITGGQ